jgi:hypothetical protein
VCRDPEENLDDQAADRPSLLWTLTEATTLLPHAKPRKAADELRRLCRLWSDIEHVSATPGARLCREPRPASIDLGDGVTLARADAESFLVERAGPWRDTTCITPRAAAFLIRLYETGRLELQRKRDRIEEPVELRRYANSEAELLEQTRRLIEEAAERERLIANPELVPAARMADPDLLDAIFRCHQPRGGPGTMRIGGMVVSKMVSSFFSNSGKNRDHDVSFHWVEADGQDHDVIKSFSRFAGNRRNDPERNWGLAE